MHAPVEGNSDQEIRLRRHRVAQALLLTEEIAIDTRLPPPPVPSIASVGQAMGAVAPLHLDRLWRNLMVPGLD